MSAGAIWLLAIMLAPLVLGLAALQPGMRARSLSLLPLAPVPALAAAVLVPEGAAFQAPDILLGARLSLDGAARVFLGFTAFLWIAAGAFARTSMRDDARDGGFAVFWLLTLAGNLGVLLSADTASFYAAFACLSLGAYVLVVHAHTKKAMRAGLVYIVLALAGETCLLLGFLLAVSGAESLLIADVREAIIVSPQRGAILALLVAGFGIKAGLFPLHLWLPLAHPAAPAPASAVLSGAIVKAGVFGLIQFLPFGAGLPEWQTLLLCAGLFTAFFGVGVGLTQDNPKTILAYSTISQMGLLIALLAMALDGGAPQAVLAAASLYALHHGLAKGALFLGAGAAMASGARAMAPVLALLALPAVSLAGLPLTGGALAKLGAKPMLGGGAAELAFTLSAAGTALLMLRFLIKTAAAGRDEADARPGLGLVLPFLAVLAASIAAPWFVFAGATGQALAYPLSLYNLWAALWPALIAAILAALALLLRLRAPSIPEGDILAPIAALARILHPADAIKSIRFLSLRVRTARPALAPLGGWAESAERLLSRWSLSGTVLLALVLLAML